MFERVEETAHDLGYCAGTVPGGGRFRAYDHGAHVTAWSPDETPVVFTSAEAVYAADKAIRGGIPVCFPWFGPGRDGQHRPAHGPARLARWQLLRMIERDDVTTLQWRLSETELAGLPGAELAPARFEVVCEQRFGADLDIQLRVRNTGTGWFSFEAALHTYLHVGDIEQVTLDGLGGSEFVDKVTGATDTQRDGVRFTGETDRVYASTADVVVDDPALGRRITVAKEGSATTVVWNPWADKARDMTDLGDDEWRRFVCVETANTGSDAVHLGVGESHLMRLRLSVAG